MRAKPHAVTFGPMTAMIRDIFYRADFGLGQREDGVFGIRDDERAAMAALRHKIR